MIIAIAGGIVIGIAVGLIASIPLWIDIHRHGWNNKR